MRYFICNFFWANCPPSVLIQAFWKCKVKHSHIENRHTDWCQFKISGIRSNSTKFITKYLLHPVCTHVEAVQRVTLLKIFGVGLPWVHRAFTLSIEAASVSGKIPHTAIIDKSLQVKCVLWLCFIEVDQGTGIGPMTGCYTPTSKWLLF